MAALTARRLLTPEQAAALDIPALARFLASPLAERIRRRRQVWREYRFALLTGWRYLRPSPPGGDAPAGRGGLRVRDGGGLTVVDFKTDRVTRRGAPSGRRRTGPSWTAYAGRWRILEKPVTERYCISSPGTEISL